MLERYHPIILGNVDTEITGQYNHGLLTTPSSYSNASVLAPGAYSTDIANSVFFHLQCSFFTFSEKESLYFLFFLPRRRLF